MARYLGEQLGVPVTIKKIAWESLVPAMKSGEINTIIAGMSYTSDRDQQLDFTSAYYVSDLVAVVKADGELLDITSIQDLSGYRVVFIDEGIIRFDGLPSQLKSTTDPRLIQFLNLKYVR